MPDDVWFAEAAESFDFSRRVPEAIASVARRRIETGAPVTLTAAEADLLLPTGAPGRDKALETLRTGGARATISR